MTMTMNEDNKIKNNSFHQAFHFLSSSNFFGSRKLKTQINRVDDSTFHEKDNTTKLLLSSPTNKLLIERGEGFSPCTTRSNSNITINSFLSEDLDLLLSPIPTPSTSTDTLELKEDLEKPWKLLKDGSIRNDDYFFMDRQDLYPVHTTTNNKIVERDTYGFKRPTQWIQTKHLHQFDAYYEPILHEQQVNWDHMLKETDGAYPPANDLKLRANCRKGIPVEHRGKAWMHYSGAQSKMTSNPELYRSLVNTAEAMGEYNEYAEIIQRDLHRTFPDNFKFACGFSTQGYGSVSMEPPETNSNLASLRRILLAFSIHSPQIGYCQSLNYLAGFFLLFLESEEEAFWMLLSTVHDYMPENMYDSTMEGANIDQAVLMMFIKERFPDFLWEKINNDDGSPPITLVTSHWFLTMFINILPVETVLRIWDCFFIEGYSVMFQVALSIIYMNREKVNELGDPIEIFQILQNMPRRLIDCPTFMDFVFSKNNKIAAVDTSQIIEKRNCVKNNRL
ncbi:unnamed protein product [Mucor hiemalis]